MAGGTKYRYPGPQEFEDTPTDSRRFFGRTREISTVADRIVASRLLVVYGSSGLGKSSLLKAGVFPRLRAENLLPIRVRLNQPGGSVLELMAEACADVARDPGREFAVEYTPGKGQTVWEFFKTVMFWRGERLVTPVLVFDQFEEIFTLADAAWRTEFGREIGPLASGNAPASVRERLRSGETGLSDQSPKVKLVFCLREEYYGSLQDLSPQFPGLFQDRFRLRPLNAKQAELAIVEPARLESAGALPESFVTPSFEYEAAAIRCMLDFLGDQSQTIEPVPLQLLCQYVEQVIVDSKRKAGALSPITITASDLGGKDAMNKVIGRFYNDSIEGLPAAERRHARELCDTGLLAPAGNRLLLERNQIAKDYKVSDATLRYLTDERRILRQEPRLQSTFYEISHDTIARSIFESRRWRLPKPWRRAAAVSVGFMIALLAIAGWAMLERNRALNLRGQAYRATAAAKLGQRRADEATAAAKLGEQRAADSEKKANQSLNKAEEMVAFLMGEDFLAKLRPMGRLNVFEDVQKRVPCQEASGGGQYSDVGLRNLALACLNEGDVDYMQFRLREANERYETARRHFSDLAGRSGKGGDASLAEALFKLARVAEDQADLDRSLELMRQSLKMQERLVASGSSDEKLLRDRARSYFYIGALRKQQGYLSEALKNFEKAIALSGRNSSTELLYIRQDGLAGQSDIFGRQGNSARSEESAKAAYECAKEAVQKSPFAPEAKYRLGVALSKLPQSPDQKPGDLVKEYREVFDDVASAASWDPENKVWARDLAATHILLGEGLVRDKQWEEAAKHYKIAISEMEELLQRDPTNRDLADTLVWVHESLGESYMQQDSLGGFSAAMKPGGGTSQQAGRESKPPLQSESRVVPVPSPEVAAGPSGRSDSDPAVVKAKDAMKEYVAARTLLKELKEHARGNVDYRYRAAWLAVWTAQAQILQHQADEAIDTCDRAMRELAAPDPTDTSYWEYKHQLEAKRGEALHSKGEDEKADEAFRAAAGTIDRMLKQYPPTSNEWNDKFLLFYDHIAPFRQSKGDTAGALAAFQQALAAVENAVVLQPRTENLQHNLAYAHQPVGDSFRDSGQFAQAQEHYAAAEKAWRTAIQLNEASADYQNRLFLLFYDHVATLRTKQKDDAGVRRAYQDCLAPIIKATELSPAEPVYQNNLALAQQQIGDDLREQGQLDQAEQRFSAAEKAWRKALQLKESAEYQNRLFLLFYDHVAALRKKQKDDAGARKAHQDSLAPVIKATELDPAELVYQDNLAIAQQQVGDDLREQGQLDQAEQRFSAAEKAWRKALQLKESAEYQNRLFLLFYDHVAALRAKQKDDAGVGKAHQDCLPPVIKATELSPTEPVYQSNLGLAQQEIGDDLREQGQLDQAQQRYSAAEKAWRKALQLKESAEYQNRLFLLFYDHVAALRKKQDDDAGVRKAHQVSLAPVMKATELDPAEPVYHNNLSLAQRQIGDDLKERGQLDQARKAYQDSLAAARKAEAAAPKVYDYRYSASLALWKIGQLQSDKRQAIETFRSAMDSLSEGMALLPAGEAGTADRAKTQTGFYVLLHDSIAPILHDLKDAPGELRALREALTAAQTAASLKREEAGYQADLGRAYRGIGDYLRQQGADQAGAAESYVHAEQAFREAVRLSPDQAGYRDELNAVEQAGKLSTKASNKK